jgi:hypothetical protein
LNQFYYGLPWGLVFLLSPSLSIGSLSIREQQKLRRQSFLKTFGFRNLSGEFPNFRRVLLIWVTSDVESSWKRLYLSYKWNNIGVLSVFVFQISIPVNDPYFWWLLIILLIIGLIAIIVIGFLLAFPIAGLAAFLVFFLTGSLLYAGITFLFVALIVAAIGQAADIGHKHSDHEHSNEHED